MRTILVAVGLAVACPVFVLPAAADPVLCQKTILKQYTVLKKKTLKGVGKCLDKQNKGDLPGPCPDPLTSGKLDLARQKVEAKVAATCSLADAATLGFVDCAYGAPGEDSAVEASCRALPVTSSAELAACISCWKEADFYEFLAVLYASHAAELCGGPLDASSTICSAGGCAGYFGATPDQRDLGDGGENDCQKAIGKAGIKYLLAREKLLEKCALEGGTRFPCLGDAELQFKLPAGFAIIYPSDTLHQVEEVTNGERLVAITFIQSRVPDPFRRNLLYNLNEVAALEGLNMQAENFTRLQLIQNQLLRCWGEKP